MQLKLPVPALAACLVTVVVTSGAAPIGVQMDPEPVTERTAELEDAGWILATFPVTPELAHDDVEIEITLTWEDPEAGDRKQAWFCQHFGADPRVRPTFPGASVCMMEPTDRAADVTAHVAGQNVHAAFADPSCERVDCYPDALRHTVRLSNWTEPGIYEDFRLADRDTAYFMVLAGGRVTDRIDIRVEANGTNVTLDAGPASNAFTYFRDDFDHDTYARADTPTGTQVAYQPDDAKLDASLLQDPDRHAVFWYMHGPWTYPNGSGPDWPGMPVASGQTGTWTFRLPGGDGPHDRLTELPLVKGAIVDLP